MAELLSSSSGGSSTYEDDMKALAHGALEDKLIKQTVMDKVFSLSSLDKRHRYLLSKFVQVNSSEHEMLMIQAYSLSLMLIRPLMTTSELEVLTLAQEAARDGLIDKEVLHQLSSLHPQVPISMKYRYLLACLNTKLEQLQDRVSILYKASCKYNINVPSVAHGPEDTPLGLDQLSYLVEKLVPYAHIWRQLGISLMFPSQDLINLVANPLLMPGAPQSYLIKLLEDWLLKNSKHVLQPTVGNLKRALNSKTVGLGTIANTLSDSLASSSSVSVPYSILKLSLTAPEERMHEVTCICSNLVTFLKLEENEVTLLEVQLETTNFQWHDVEFQYRWLMNNMLMDRDSGNVCLSGFSSPSLRIEADTDSDGCKLSCEVKVPGAVNACKTDPVVLCVNCSLDEYRDSLSLMYLKQPEVPEDTWPPVSNKKHINLALIKQQAVNYKSHCTRVTIRGDADDILQYKERISYRDVYESLRSGQLLLIEGRPGSGKTTFIHKVTRDWAASSGGKIRLMLLVSLRVLNSFHNPSLSDILKLFQDLKVSADHIERRDGKNVCFVFDGLDEFSPPDGKESIVHKLIMKRYLSQSTVVVASRPAAIAMFRDRADRVVEVLGFLSDQILEYFDYYPFSHSTKSAELKHYLSFHPNILHMCYLPIHAATVAFLFDVTGEVPKTETEIYKHFTRFTLMRSLSKNKEDVIELKDMNNLSGEERSCFTQICKLAFEKTVSNKQVLNQDEVSSYFLIRKGIDMSLGLITIDRTAGLYGYKNVYTFLHLTFQEYLAASHVCGLSTEEQSKLIQEHGDKDHMLVVWKFYCGLATFKPYDNLFKSILCRTEDYPLHQVQCTYESQQRIACVQFLKAVHRHIKIANKYLSIPDFTAIGYVVNKMSALPTKLSLIDCNFTIEEVDALLSEMGPKSRQLLQGLHIEEEIVDAAKMGCVEKLFTNLRLKNLFLKAKTKTTLENFHPPVGEHVQFTCLTELSLVNVEITALQLLIDMHAMKDLRVLNLEGSIIEGCTLFLDGLKYCSNLQELNARGVNISWESAMTLSSSLQACRDFERITLDGGICTTTILRSLTEHKMKIVSEDIGLSIVNLIYCLRDFTNLKSLDICLKTTADSHSFKGYCNKWHKLEELRIRNDTWNSDTVSIIHHHLSYLKELQIFALHKTVASFCDIKSIMTSLQCPNLRVLDLSNNRIGPEAITALAPHLMDFPSLKQLVLDNNRIGDDGAKTLFSYLQHCNNLQELSLANNGIGSDGCMELAANLHHCTLLRTLDFRKNDISRKAAHAIATSVRISKFDDGTETRW